MEGYLTAYGYMGRIGSRWMIFVSEDEYREYYTEYYRRNYYENETYR